MKAFRVAALCLSAALPFGAAPANAQQPGPAPEASRPVDERVPQPLREEQFPLGVAYVAVSLNGRDFPGEKPAVILDTNFSLRGFAGCNNYSAIAYPQPDQGIAVGPFALTNRECDRATMTSERGFLTALRGAQRWRIEGNVMTISGPGGELRFERSL
ncbi:MAG: META domain-containing protein [Microvirga sp.]|nr:META domain-containing protein [Microvirga sp.]